MRRRGFTLLEVMVALSILAMSLVAAFDVVGGALRNHERTRHLELATMLARAKLAEVEAGFEEDGFRDSEQKDDGNFGEEGHPEVSWSVKTVKPTVELGPEGVVKALTGADGGLEGLLGLAPEGKGGASGQGSGGPTSAISGMAGPALAAIKGQLTALGEEIKKGVREVQLTVSWKEGASEESFTVTTHMVVLVPGSQAPAPAPAGLPAGGAGLPGGPGPNLPGFNTNQGITPKGGPTFRNGDRIRPGSAQ